MPDPTKEPVSDTPRIPTPHTSQSWCLAREAHRECKVVPFEVSERLELQLASVLKSLDVETKRCGVLRDSHAKLVTALERIERIPAYKAAGGTASVESLLMNAMNEIRAAIAKGAV